MEFQIHKKALPLKPNPNAGLRYRQWNIEVGDEKSTVDLFDDKRGTTYFIGEIHTIPGTIKVNARRDEFTFNEITQVLKAIEKHLYYSFTTFFERLMLSKIFSKQKRYLKVK